MKDVFVKQLIVIFFYTISIVFLNWRLFGYAVETLKHAFGVVKRSLTTNSLVWLASM